MVKTGKIIATRVVSDDGDLTLISREGIMLRTRLKDIPSYSRATARASRRPVARSIATPSAM